MSHISAASIQPSTFPGSSVQSTATSSAGTDTGQPQRDFQCISAAWLAWEKMITAASPPRPPHLLNDMDDHTTMEKKWKEFGELTDAAIKDIVEAFEEWKKANEEEINAWHDSLNFPADFDDAC
ncbi:hypothetical protein C8J57DRAFT_1464449 [Mycena rebaudengoi]|nr:hypothetical protein C8J57DRAFT_1464449 [Mycena rebaudengoi]